jgi:uncharacterized protein (TIGR03435 family)
MMAISVIAWGQAPAFDVASIKLSAPGRGGHGNPLGELAKVTPVSVTMQRVTLKNSIQWAYHVFDYQVSGPPSIDSDRYDIAAKSAGPAGEAELRVMMQTLLAERFKLKLHRQSKETQAYVLSVGKNGPKFHESAAEGESAVQPDEKTMKIKVERVPISQLIDPLSRMFQAPVVDMTGLTGRYDVSIDVGKFLSPTGDNKMMDPLSMIQTGLQEELGLKLEPRKLSLDFLVVDHAAKTPIGN